MLIFKKEADTKYLEYPWNKPGITFAMTATICYSDVITGTMVPQITSLTIVYSNAYSGTDQRRLKSSASLAFVRGIHRWPVNSPHKGPVTWKMFPFDDVLMMAWVPCGAQSWVASMLIRLTWLYISSLGTRGSDEYTWRQMHPHMAWINSKRQIELFIMQIFMNIFKLNFLCWKLSIHVTFVHIPWGSVCWYLDKELHRFSISISLG